MPLLVVESEVCAEHGCDRMRSNRAAASGGRERSVLGRPS